MNNSFMSPLPTFTLESLVANGRWTAAQNASRKKAGLKASPEKKPQGNVSLSEKPHKS